MDTKMIGSKIAKARKQKNMSQASLAQLLFISPQAVGKWERGESMPDITTFNRIAEILDVDLNFFAEGLQPARNDLSTNAATGTNEVDKQPSLEITTPLPVQKSQARITLTTTNLQNSDFSGAILHKTKFKLSPLQGSNFSGADLTGSIFDTISARQTTFDTANLTDVNFYITDLMDASFRKPILVRTSMNMSGQGARFIDVTLVDVKFIKTDLRKTVFENCVFNGVDFSYCDLRGKDFSGVTFDGSRFDKSALNDVSFKGATLRNVSIIVPFSVTNRSYRALETICFDGTRMDKLTYAALKGLHVIDLSKVIII